WRNNGPTRLYEQLDVRAEVTMRGRNQPAEVGVDVRRLVTRFVRDSQPAPEVVDPEFAERGQCGDFRLELFQLKDLRSNVHVQSAQVYQRRRAHSGDGRRGLLNRNAELRGLAAGRQRRMGSGLNAGTDPQQHRHRTCPKCFYSINIVEAVHDDVADAGVDRCLDIGV